MPCVGWRFTHVPINEYTEFGDFNKLKRTHNHFFEGEGARISKDSGIITAIQPHNGITNRDTGINCRHSYT